MPMPTPPSARRRRAVAAVVLVVVLVGGAIGAYVVLQSAAGIDLSAEAIQARIKSWGIWGVVGSIVLMALHSFIPFPAEVVAIANGMVFGPIWGTLITWTVPWWAPTSHSVSRAGSAVRS